MNPRFLGVKEPLIGEDVTLVLISLILVLLIVIDQFQLDDMLFHKIVMQNDLKILFDNLSPKSVVRLFRAFRDACEALPEQQRELFYDYCRVNSSDLLRLAEANLTNGR